MIRKTGLCLRLLSIALSIFVPINAYSLSEKTDTLPAVKTVERELTQEEVDSVYVIPYKPKQKAEQQDTATVVAAKDTVILAEIEDNTQDYVMPDTSNIDFVSMRKYLKNTLYPSIDAENNYGDTIVLPSISLPFVYFEDRIPDMAGLPDPAGFYRRYMPYEARFAKINLFGDIYKQNEIDRSVYLYVVDNHPDYIKRRLSDFDGILEKVEEIAKDENELRNIFKIEYDLNQTKIDQFERFSPKKRYWLWSGKHYLSITQADNSTNWSDTTKSWGEKGIGAMNLVSVQTITGKYKKGKLEINQNLEWRLNIANSMNDSLRSIKIVEDRLRSYTDFGITAFKNWNYSSFLEITTPLLTTFVENKPDSIRVQSFLSPVKLGFGIGMKYNLTKTYQKFKGRKVVFAADVSPLSIQNIFIMDYLTNPALHGLKLDGELSAWNKRGLNQFDLGTTINSTLAVNYNKWVSLNSRLKYFTNYSKSYMEFENTLNMPINRFISTRLYFYLTFDDSRAKNHQFGYFTVNETIGFTFNVQW
jgi:hypothetical protein